MITIPRADSPNREDFNNTIVARIIGPRAYCPDCADKVGADTNLYGINVAPYSVVCQSCNVLIVDGWRSRNGDPVCIFDGA